MKETISQQLETNLNRSQYITFKYFDSNIVIKKSHNTTMATKRKYNEIILRSKYKLMKVLKTDNVILCN